MKTYFERLRGLQEDNDITQEQVARVLGTSQTMYARYERGANELPLRHLKVLCQLFNTSSDDILGVALDPHRPKGRVSAAFQRQCRAEKRRREP